MTYFKKPIYSLAMNYKISRNLEYALMALSYMSKQKNTCVSAREMVHIFHLPFHPFSRVMQKLADQGFIQSKKGLGGGYIFTKNLKNLSLYTLISAILPPIEIATCLSGYCHLFNYCNIQKPIHYLNKKFLEFYKTLSLEEILNCDRTQSSFHNKKNLKPYSYKTIKGQNGSYKKRI